jgi:hemoglobin-like flavoprotein
MFESEEFIEAARTTSSLMDMSVSLLECEMDALFGQLLEIGLEHASFPRIQTNHWSMMRDALLKTLASYSSALSDDSKDLEKVLSAWSLVFDNLSNEMVETIKPMKRKSWDSVSTTQGDSVSQDSSASSAGWSQNR